MTTLRDFLSREADQWNAQAAQRAAKRDEWVAAVRRLFDQIKAWLHEADTKGVLTITEQTHEFQEVGLGHYEAPGMTVTLGTNTVRIVPVARNIAGSVGDPSFRAQGLIELTAAGLRYMLYRVVDERGEWWRLVNDSNYRTEPFDKASFEAAFLRLFS
jgi:hypothetical protein